MAGCKPPLASRPSEPSPSHSTSHASAASPQPQHQPCQRRQPQHAAPSRLSHASAVLASLPSKWNHFLIVLFIILPLSCAGRCGASAPTPQSDMRPVGAALWPPALFRRHAGAPPADLLPCRGRCPHPPGGRCGRRPLRPFRQPGADVRQGFGTGQVNLIALDTEHLVSIS